MAKKSFTKVLKRTKRTQFAVTHTDTFTYEEFSEMQLWITPNKKIHDGGLQKVGRVPTERSE